MSLPGGNGTPGDPMRKWGREFGPFLTLGLQLAITVVAFFFLGRWLDTQLGTDPWLMLTGLAVGVTGSLIKFIRTAVKLGKESEERDREGSGGH